MRIVFSLIIATLAILISDTRANSSQRPLIGAPLPKGWGIFSSSLPGKEVMRCANYSRSNWAVSLNGDKISIAPMSEYKHTVTMPFHGGTLKGEDDGEFGGGLWWIAPNGQAAKIGNENIRGLIQTSFGMFALAGLAHLGTDYGTVYRVNDEGRLPPNITSVASLGDAPEALTLDSLGDLVIVTSRSIQKFKSSGKIQKLTDVDYSGLFPTSVAIDSRGIIYVGLRHFVTRLISVNGKVQEDWLVPNECRHFEIQKFNCICLTSHDAKSTDVQNRKEP